MDRQEVRVERQMKSEPRADLINKSVDYKYIKLNHTIFNVKSMVLSIFLWAFQNLGFYQVSEKQGYYFCCILK
jgi:hypothetical protein